MEVLHEHMDQFQNYQINFDGKMDLLPNILSWGLNIRDSTGNTLLHLVLRQIKTNVIDLVKHLLEMGIDINALNNSGQSPLHYAVKYKNCSLDLLKLLVNRGAKVNQKTYVGLTPLNYAMEKDYPLDAITFLFKHSGKSQFENEFGISLMHFAVMRNMPADVIQLLIDKGVDFHAVSGINNHGESAMHLAVAFKRTEILKLLLKQPGVQVDLPDYMGYSPLHHSVAASTCDTSVVKLLLDSGADVKKKTRAGMQAIHLAMYLCRIEVIKLLLQHGAQVNVVELCGRTPLYLAVKFCCNENIEVLKLLLDAGAYVFYKSSTRGISPYDDGTSALLVASKKYYRKRSENSLQQVKLLLKYALIEHPEITYENLTDDKEICALLSQYGSECLRELHSTCVNGRMTLAQFILRLREPEDEDSHTDEIMDLLVANAHPLYKEVVLSFLKRKVLEEKFKEKNVFSFKKGPQPYVLRRVVLHYDALCSVMKYLSKIDLLNLYLAFYDSNDGRWVDFPAPNEPQQAIAAESNRVFKRAKVN